MQQRNDRPHFSTKFGKRNTLIELRDYEEPNYVRVYNVATGELKRVENPIPYHMTFNSRRVINE